MRRKAELYYWLLALLFIGLMGGGCATVGSPTGGPRDSLPPILVGTSPRPMATNFNGKKVLLLFNEYVNLKDQSKLFFMSPPGQKKPTLTVKGKAILTEFQEPLDSNTTYRLDFGNSVVDNNENNPAVGLSFVFSTGPEIDSLIMAGQTIDAYTRDTVIGAYVFYFNKWKDEKLDSTMYNGRASALFRSDSSGYFVADILKGIDYKVYALGDDNGNQMYEAGVDLIGFRDTTYNPFKLPEFSMWYDSTARRWGLSNAQITFEMFKEDPPKRQTLLENKRPNRQKLTMVFNSTNTVIDTLDFRNLPATWVTQSWNAKRDSLTMWIAPETEEDLAKNLPDTLKVRLAYQKQDSLWKYYSYGQDLTFGIAPKLTKKRAVEDDPKWILKDSIRQAKKAARLEAKLKARAGKPEKPKARERRLQREKVLRERFVADSTAKAKADSTAKKQANPFNVKVNASSEFIPLNELTFDFDYPLANIETTNITLKHFPSAPVKGRQSAEQQKMATEGRKMKYNFAQDSLLSTRWYLKADWVVGDSYELMIPSGAFTNIAYRSNDTLKAKFNVATPDKFSTYKVTFAGDSASMSKQYILEVVSGQGKDAKIVRRYIVPPGTKGEVVKMEYITPGSYRVRIIEDDNRNGIWDTGKLTERRQPERVRLWRHPNSSPLVTTKENWVVTLNVEPEKLFRRP